MHKVLLCCMGLLLVEFYPYPSVLLHWHWDNHIDWLMQERRNSSALAMALHLSCTKPSIWLMKMMSRDLIFRSVWSMHQTSIWKSSICYNFSPTFANFVKIKSYAPCHGHLIELTTGQIWTQENDFHLILNPWIKLIRFDKSWKLIWENSPCINYLSF